MYKFNHIRIGNVAKMYNVSIPTIWRWVKEDPKQHVPNKGSIIYSVWNKDEKFIYIVISGTKKT